MATKPQTRLIDRPRRSWLPFFKRVFLVAAAYDSLLGALFFFFFRPIYDLLGIPIPDNTSYIHLLAGFVFVQGVAYWLVYRHPLRNADIVRMGVLYKAIYTGVGLYYLRLGELPDAIFAWFAVFDLVFLALFVAFLLRVRAADVFGSVE